MASITERRNAKGEITSYRIRVSGGFRNGKRIVHTTEFHVEKGMSERQAEKEAKRIEMEAEQKCKSGGLNSRMTLNDYIPRYLKTMENTKNMSPTTIDTYIRHINNFIVPTLGEYKLKDIKPAHIQELINMLATKPKMRQNGKMSDETLSASSVKRYLNVVQSIFTQAVKEGLIYESPALAKRLTIPKAQKQKIDIFTKQEAAKMLACLEKEDLQFQTLIQLAIFTGARRGELAALKFSDVDFEQRKLTIERAAYKAVRQPLSVKPPKDYETRTVTINKTCCELLKLLQEEKLSKRERLGSKWVDGDWIFTQWNGEMMNPQTPTKKFSKFLEKNGLKHRNFHSLRHIYATLMIKQGVDIRVVQRWLGHSSIETTQRYLHSLETDKDYKAVTALESALLSNSNTPK